MINASRAARLALIGLLVTTVMVTLALLQHSLAAAAPTAAGVTIQPPTDTRSGVLGELVTHTVRVTNTGSVTDIFTLTVTGQTWATNIFVIPGTVIVPNTTVLILLNAGEGRDVNVRVRVPLGGVMAGDSDVTVFSATSQIDPSVSASATLTTTVSGRQYLPLVMKP